MFEDFPPTNIQEIDWKLLRGPYDMRNGKYLARNEEQKNKPLFHRGFGTIRIEKPLWNNAFIFCHKFPIDV